MLAKSRPSPPVSVPISRPRAILKLPRQILPGRKLTEDRPDVPHNCEPTYIIHIHATIPPALVATSGFTTSPASLATFAVLATCTPFAVLAAVAVRSIPDIVIDTKFGLELELELELELDLDLELNTNFKARPSPEQHHHGPPPTTQRGRAHRPPGRRT